MNDQAGEQRHDDCPDCGEQRTELTVAPGRFYCPLCQLAGAGPAPLRVGTQLALEEAQAA